MVTETPAASDISARSVGSKVIRDVEREAKPSRGYGFVDFPSHAYALAALRYANNNPDLSPFAQVRHALRMPPLCVDAVDDDD